MEALEALYFPVELRDADTFFGRNMASNYRKVVFAPTLNKVLNLPGKSYRLQPNRELFEPIYQQLVASFGRVGVEVVSEDDRRFWVYFIPEGLELRLQQTDPVLPVIEVINSYDGSLRFQVRKNYLRAGSRCPLPGLISRVLSRTAKHTSDTDVPVDDFIYMARNAAFHAQVFEGLDTPLDAPTLQRVLEAIRFPRQTVAGKRTDVYPKRLVDLGEAALYQQAGLTGSYPSYWLLYAALNEMLYRDPRVGLSHDVREQIDRSVHAIITRFAPGRHAPEKTFGQLL